MVLMGDLNINLLNHNSHNLTSEFLDSIVSHGLLPHITLPTHVTHSSVTLIDHVFSNINPHQTLATTLKTDISYHYANFICIKWLPHNIVKPKFIQFRNISKTKVDIFNNALIQTDWSDILTECDPNLAYDNLVQIYILLIILIFLL